MLIIFPSGSYFCSDSDCGYFFWGAHGHDGIWHLSNAQVAFSQLPPFLPIFSGGFLAGYNYLFDLILALPVISGLHSNITYFKILPLVWFFLYTGFSIVLARKIKDTPLFVALLLFFFYFAGSFGYLLTLYHSKTIIGSESLLAMQSGHTLINPPFAFSLLPLLAVLIIVLDKKPTFKSHLFLAVLIAVTFGFKFYAGVIALAIVGLYYLINIVVGNNRLNTTRGLIFITILSALVLLIFYDPLSNRSSGAIFKFDPLATVHPFIEQQNLFYLPNTVLQRYFLQKHQIGLRLIYIELLTLTLFLLFNFGTRILGAFYLLKQIINKKVNYFESILTVSIILGIILATMLVQKGEWWNSIQFIYYSLFLSNIFIALFLYEILKKKTTTRLVFTGLVLLLTIPINLDLIYQFSRFPAPAYLPKREIEALAFLKKQPKGTVLTLPYDKSFKSLYNPPYPLFAYDDTAYVPAFSGQRVYLTNKTQLRLLGVDYKNRLLKVLNRECSVISSIDYIYELKSHLFVKDFDKCGVSFKKLFANDAISVYSK